MKYEIFIAFVLSISRQYSITAVSPFEWITYDKLFIDKTELIKIFLTNTANVSGDMITCPNGFGKTVNLDMIRRFFEIAQNDERKAENERIFRDPRLNLEIMRDKDFVDAHYGKYPVILISFEMTENATTIEKILEELHNKINQTFTQYQWLYDNKTNFMDQRYADLGGRKLCEKFFSKTANPQDLKISLKTLSKDLYQYYKKPIILLFDDCDSPLMAALQNGIYSKIFPTFLSLLENVLEIDEQYALLTGISAITKHSRFHALSSVHRYYFLRRHVYSEYFGFTLKEMQHFYSTTKFMPKFENELEKFVEPFYGGYLIEEDTNNTSVFSKTHIFKPASVSHYFNERISEFSQKFYYFENPMIRPEMIVKLDERLSNAQIRDAIETIILKKSIRFLLKRERESTREINVLEKLLTGIKSIAASNTRSYLSQLTLYLSLLFDMGYITYSGEKGLFVIPNEEMKLHLLIHVNRYLIKNIPSAEQKCVQVVKNLQIILECENAEVVEKTEVKLAKLLEDIISHLDQLSERDIHSLIYTITTLYNSGEFQDVQPEVKVDKILENETKIIEADEADIVILSNLSKNLLFVDIKNCDYRCETLAKVESYRPKDSQLDSLDLLKFLLINVGKSGRVRVTTGESVFPYS